MPDSRTIKGKTTFKEVLDWGVSQAEIEAILKGKIPNTGLTIQDYCAQQGIEFSTVKSALQEKIDASLLLLPNDGISLKMEEGNKGAL